MEEAPSSTSFIHHNGNCPNINIPCSPPELEISDDIEMIPIQSVGGYTSLRDLLPSSTIMSPTNSSWNEIPIKNPLVKHAALAYLQPTWTPPDQRGRTGLLWRLTDACGWSEDGCLWWLRGAVVRLFTGVSADVEDDDDDDDDEKVD